MKCFGQKKLLFFIILTVAFQSFAAQINLQRIEPARVEFYQKKIAWDFKKNSFIRTALVTGLFSTAAYSLYMIYNASPSESTTNLISKESISEEALNAFKSAADKLIKNDPTLIAKQGFFQKVRGWFKDAFVMMVNQAGALCILDLMRGVANPITKYVLKLDHAFDSAIQSIFYKRTLPWFLEKHTQIFVFLDEIEKKCTPTENEIKADLLPADNASSIEKNWEIVAEQVCSTIAFMNIMMENKARSSCLLAIQGKTIIDKIIAIINGTAQSIEQSFATQDKSLLSGKIKVVKLLIQQEFDSFSKIESAQLYS